MSVATSPGATTFTRTPGRSSRASVFASASTAALAMLYGAPPAGCRGWLLEIR